MGLGSARRYICIVKVLAKRINDSIADKGPHSFNGTNHGATVLKAILTA
jgi:hypothetical protein